jgi:23S rRNA (guanosine2251-2'-O)-methyltransferase
VAELLNTDAGRVVRLVFLEGSRSQGINQIAADAKRLKIPFDFVGRSRLDGLTGTAKHQGVVAQVAAMAYVELDDLIARAKARGPGLIVVLDEVSDPRNLGAVMRTAEAAGAHGIIIPKRRAAPATELVAKVSAGAFMHLPLVRVDNVVQALDRLKSEDYWVYGLSADAKSTVSDPNYSGPTALVLGAESKGLRPLVARHCDQLVRIPLSGKTPSLNVSVAAAVAIFAVVGQRDGWGT